MDLILNDFKADLDRVSQLFSFFQMLQTFATKHQVPQETTDEFLINAGQLLTKTKESQADFRILVGTMLLYLGNR